THSFAHLSPCVLLTPRSPSCTPPHAVPAFCVECRRARGTVLRARGKWNSDARRPSRPLHPRPPAPPPLVLLIHRRPRSSSHPLSPPYIPPHPNQARRVCSISAHVERAGCRYRVPNVRGRATSRPLHPRPPAPSPLPPSSTLLRPSSPSSPPYTPPHLNQARPRTRRGCRGRVCALPAHADGAERMCGGSWAPAEFACARSVLGGHGCVAVLRPRPTYLESRPTPSHAARAVPAPSRVPPPHTSRRCRVPMYIRTYSVNKNYIPRQPLWGFCLMRTKRSERGLESNVAQLIEVEYTELKT
ncbi:hypothetical protein C8F04DRAFT_1138324, partial [Mycena alexandri]